MLHSVAVRLSNQLNLRSGSIGVGTRRANAPPNKTIGGATSTSCSPNFFCNLQLKVTLKAVILHF